MKMDKNTMKIISDMEYIVGNQCYNPNSYNGWTSEEGCSYRYLVYSAQKDEQSNYIAEKYRGKIRDLKPENIFVININDGHEVIKIVDFGLARPIQTKSDDRPLRVHYPSADAMKALSGNHIPMNMTIPGTVMGTPYPWAA